MKKLFTTALVLGSVATLAACGTTTANEELPAPYGLERTAGHATANSYGKMGTSKKEVSRLERTYSAAQSK